MSKQMVLILIGITLGAWILIGEKSSVFEKLFIIFSIVAIYVGFMFLTGASLDEILSILR